jgi:hypothetical protein
MFGVTTCPKAQGRYLEAYQDASVTRDACPRRVRRARQVVVAAHVALDLHELIRVERAIVATLTELKARPLPFVEPYHDAKFSTPCLLC